MQESKKYSLFIRVIASLVQNFIFPYNLDLLGVLQRVQAHTSLLVLVLENGLLQAQQIIIVKRFDAWLWLVFDRLAYGHRSELLAVRGVRLELGLGPRGAQVVPHRVLRRLLGQPRAPAVARARLRGQREHPARGLAPPQPRGGPGLAAGGAGGGGPRGPALGVEQPRPARGGRPPPEPRPVRAPGLGPVRQLVVV